MDLKKLKIGFNNFIRQISCNEKVEVFFLGGVGGRVLITHGSNFDPCKISDVHAVYFLGCS